MSDSEKQPEFKKFDLFSSRASSQNAGSGIFKQRQKSSRLRKTSPFLSPSVPGISSPAQRTSNRRNESFDDSSYYNTISPGKSSKVRPQSRTSNVSFATPSESLGKTISVPLKTTPATNSHFRRTPAKVKGLNLSQYADSDSSFDADLSRRCLIESIHKSLDDVANSVKEIGSRQATPAGSHIGTPRLALASIDRTKNNYSETNKFKRMETLQGKRKRQDLSDSDEEVETIFEEMNSTSDKIAKSIKLKLDTKASEGSDWSSDKWKLFAQLIKRARELKDSDLVYNPNVMRRYHIKSRLELNLRITLVKQVLFKRPKPGNKAKRTRIN